jgi:hypothetical protein
MAYNSELPCCFSDGDLLLSVHPLDKQRAFEWLVQSWERQATWSDEPHRR